VTDNPVDRAPIPPEPGPAQPNTLPAVADLVTALPYLVHPAADPFLVIYSSTGELQTISRLLDDNGPDDITAAAALVDVLLEETDADSAHLIAYTGAENVPALRTVAIAKQSRLRQIIQVHDGRWSDLTAPGTEGRKIPTTLEFIDSSMIDLAAVHPSGYPEALRPGPEPTLKLVRELMHQISIHESSEPITTEEHLTLLKAERYLRREASVPLEPARAAQVLIALAEQDVWRECLVWADAGTQRLWLDVIRCAPLELVAPVATLIAATSFQRGMRLHAWVAALRARETMPSPFETEHDDLIDGLARIIRKLLHLHLSTQEFRSLLRGASWALEITKMP